MSITQAEAIAAVRSSIDEPTEVYWDDTDIRRWINDIAKDMARRTECLRGFYTQPVVAGTASYTPAFTLTENAYRVYRVEWIPENDTQTYPLTHYDPNEADSVWGISQNTTEGMPAIWTSWGFPPSLTIQVFPIPSQAGDLKLWYYRLPAQLSISTEDDMATALDIVEGWEDVLVEGVSYKAKLRDNDSNWNLTKQEYEQHLDAMNQAVQHFTDAAGMITTPNGSFIPGWLYGDGEGW